MLAYRSCNKGQQRIEGLEANYHKELQEFNLILSDGDDVAFSEIGNAFNFPTDILKCNGSIIIDMEKNPQSTSLDVLALAFVG